MLLDAAALHRLAGTSKVLRNLAVQVRATDAARRMAVAARGASRVLQGLSSQVGHHTLPLIVHICWPAHAQHPHQSAQADRLRLLLQCMAQPALTLALHQAGTATAVPVLSAQIAAHSHALAAVQEREAILEKVAAAIEANKDHILAENEADVRAAEGKIDAHLMNRLRLKPQKLQQLAKGIRAIAAQDEPLRKARPHAARALRLCRMPADGFGQRALQWPACVMAAEACMSCCCMMLLSWLVLPQPAVGLCSNASTHTAAAYAGAEPARGL